jgi:hypothetical protein
LPNTTKQGLSRSSLLYSIGSSFITTSCNSSSQAVNGNATCATCLLLSLLLHRNMLVNTQMYLHCRTLQRKMLLLLQCNSYSGMASSSAFTVA